MLTKSDKLKRGAAQNALLGARKQLADYPNASIQVFSSLSKTGIDTLEATLDQWFADPVEPVSENPISTTPA